MILALYKDRNGQAFKVWKPRPKPFPHKIASNTTELSFDREIDFPKAREVDVEVGDWVLLDWPEERLDKMTAKIIKSRKFQRGINKKMEKSFVKSNLRLQGFATQADEHDLENLRNIVAFYKNHLEHFLNAAPSPVSEQTDTKGSTV